MGTSTHTEQTLGQQGNWSAEKGTLPLIRVVLHGVSGCCSGGQGGTPSGPGGKESGRLLLPEKV